MNRLPFLGSLKWGNSRTHGEEEEEYEESEEEYEESEEDSEPEREHEIQLYREQLGALATMYEQMLLGTIPIVDDEKLANAHRNLLQQRDNCTKRYGDIVSKTARELAESVIREEKQAREDEQKRIAESVKQYRWMAEEARKNRPRTSPPRRLLS